MKLIPLALSLLGGLAAAWPRGTEEEWVVLIGGDTDGYLAPCGCTKPMTGGIQRRAAAIQALRTKQTLILENGGLVSGNGRQDELKAEAMAEFLGKMQVDAIHVTPSETRLGTGEMMSIANLAGDRLVSTSLTTDLPIRPYVVRGPFIVGGVSMQAQALSMPIAATAGSPTSAVSRLLNEADGRAAILMLSGTLADARSIARQFPNLALILYRSGGTPAQRQEREGKTWLVSPGDRGKYLIRLGYRTGGFATYGAMSLGPEYKAEAATQRIYDAYLKRVDEENLIDRLPREEGPKYAGTQTCGSCHREPLKVWLTSKHAIATKSLESQGHARDPDCVRCHVVGLSSTQGFVSRLKTPDLANVGCESCHGPGADHSVSPDRKMPKVDEKTCLACHDPENSPSFDFAAYWPRILHR